MVTSSGISADDSRAIYKTIATYCRSIDRLDWQGVRGCYTADGIDHHTGFDGTADEYVSWVRTKLSQFSGTMHILGTHLSDPVDGGDALSETYGTAVHWGEPTDDASRNFTSGFRYVDHLRREGDRWLIVERFAVREWTMSNAGRMVSPEGAGPRGTRDQNDPLAQLHARLTSAN